MAPSRPWPLLLTLSLCAAPLWSCRPESCLSGAADCKVVPACSRLSFECSAQPLELTVIDTLEPGPRSPDAQGARGDIRLSNGRATAVIAGLGNQNDLDPNGGSLLDLSVPGKHDDGLSDVWQGVGILPGDAVRYTGMKLFDERPDRIAVQLTGTLDGRPGVKVFTLYEMRPCDPGVRVRTELLNASTDTELWAVADGFYWYSQNLPFAPAKGEGFSHPSWNLLTVNDVFAEYPYVVGNSRSAPQASFAELSCDRKMLIGFHSDVVSSLGLPKTVIPPREYQVFERFLAVADADDVAGAGDLALQAREQLWGERSVTLRGHVERPGATAVGSERETSVLISEGKVSDDASARTPWSQVVPDAEGNFSARVPSQRDYVVEVSSFAQRQIEKEVRVAESDLELGTFTLPSLGRVTLQVSEEGSARGPTPG